MGAAVMRAPKCALVLGNTIHLHGANESDITNNPAWLSHELVHIAQYKRYGTIPFLVRYLWFSIRYGYYENPLEKEARSAEQRSV